MNNVQNNGKELTPQEKVALQGFLFASRANGGFVRSLDAYYTLAFLEDPNLAMIRSSQNMPYLAEALHRKGYLEKHIDKDLYKPRKEAMGELLHAQ